MAALPGILAPAVRAQIENTATRPTDTQPTSTQPAATTQSAVAEMQRLTLSDVQLRLRQTQANPELDEGAKAALLSLYSQAIQQLELASQCAAVAAEQDAARAAAPARLQELASESEAQASQPIAPLEFPPEAPLEQIEDALVQAESEMERARIAQRDLITLRDRSLRRRLELPGLLTATRQQLAELAESHDAPGESRDSSDLELARQTLLQARRIALETEVQRYEKELLRYSAQRDLVKRRLELAGRRVVQLEERAGALRRRVQEQRRSEIEAALVEFRERVDQAHAAVRPIAEACLRLAQERSDLNDRMQRAEEQSRELEERLGQLRDDRERIQKRLQVVEMTGGAGELLRKDRARLADLRPHEANLRQHKSDAAAARQRMSELEELRSSMPDEDRVVGTLRAGGALPADPDELEALVREARRWTRWQQEQGEALLEEYGAYFNKLVQLEAREQEFVDAVQQVAAYMDANALWVRSTPVPGGADLASAGEALLWLGGSGDGRSLLQSARDAWRAQYGALLIGLLILSALLVFRGALHAALAASGERVFRPGKDSIVFTLKALGCTALLAAAWPAALGWCAWLLTPPGEIPEISRALAAGLTAAAGVLLTMQFAAQLVRSGGLAEKHFRWRAAALRPLRLHLRWLTPILAAAVLVFAGLEAQTVEARKASLGRAAFVVACLALAIFAHRLLRPAGGLWPAAPSGKREGWMGVLPVVSRAVMTAAPLALAGGALLGYYGTGLQLSWMLLQSVWLGLALLVLSALLRRWLLYRMQLRALREARQRAAQAAQRPDGAPAAEAGPVVTEEPGVDLAEVRLHTSRLARAALTVAAVVAGWMIWSDVLPSMDVLRSVVLWTDHVEVAETVALPDGASTITTVKRPLPVTPVDLGLCLALLLLTVVASRNLPGLLEVAILERLPLTPSGRYAIATLSRYVITVVGTILAFNAIGVGWSKVQWLVAAMTVGLGFGLQEIFANFVSGLIILFERPIRVGDAVTVGGTSGIVTRIRIRATTITDWDRKELIVPNKRFITGEVLNWTLTDPTIRLTLPVSVAHGSSPAVVHDTLLRIAREHPNIVSEPAPSAVFKGLGPASMDFDFSVFVRREDYGKVLHELNSAVEEALVATGIGIAVPIQLHQIQVRAAGSAAPPAAAAR